MLYYSLLKLISMKYLVVLATIIIALGAGNAIPVIPGDNSDYVEGESRYIWMPDGEGVPHLVDLHQPVDEQMLNAARNSANSQYWLYTRQNQLNPQIIVHGNANTVWNSNYNSARPLKVLVHGWNSNGNSNMNSLITSAFLTVQDCNIIVVDWNRLANGFYTTAVRGVPGVGQFLGNFLTWLIGTAGGNWNDVHLIGFSLGAHVVGNAGRTTGSRPARITGLDPAGPQWGGNSNALKANDGQYVECIHTDGRRLGIFNPIGQTNFYPNGGQNRQPGCWLSTCSHSRAPELFASSVRTNHFAGRQCTSTNQVSNPNLCTGSVLMMGNGVITKRGSGIYALTTGNSWPY